MNDHSLQNVTEIVRLDDIPVGLVDAQEENSLITINNEALPVPLLHHPQNVLYNALAEGMIYPEAALLDIWVQDGTGGNHRSGREKLVSVHPSEDVLPLSPEKLPTLKDPNAVSFYNCDFFGPAQKHLTNVIPNFRPFRNIQYHGPTDHVAPYYPFIFYPSAKDEHDYSIDAMYLCFDTSVDILVAGTRMGHLINPIFDRTDGKISRRMEGRRGRRIRTIIGQSLALDLRGPVLNWLKAAPAFERVHAAYCSLFDSARQIESFCQDVAGTLVDSHLRINGHPRDFFDDIGLGDQIEIPDLHTEQDLLHPENINKTLSQRERRLWLKEMKLQHKRTEKAVKEMPFTEYVHALRADWNLKRQVSRHDLREPIVILRGVPHIRIIDGRPLIERENRLGGDWIAPASPAIVKDRKQQLQQGKKALRRSVQMCEKLSNVGDIKTFIRGDSITIEGHRWNYKATKTKSLLDHTINPSLRSIPYKMEIMSKSGTVMGSGCIYFPDTPIIDQIFLLALHVKDREMELDIVKATNWHAYDTITQDKELAELIQPKRMFGITRNIFGDDVPENNGEAEQRYNQYIAQSRARSQFWLRRREMIDHLMPHVKKQLQTKLKIPAPVFDFMANAPEMNIGTETLSSIINRIKPQIDAIMPHFDSQLRLANPD